MRPSSFNARFITLLLLASNVSIICADEAKTLVYKKQEADGSITYSDSPFSGAKAIEVPPVHTVPAFTLPPNQAATKNSAMQMESYHSLSILEPKNDSAFHSPTGTINIRLAVEPALQAQHTVQVILDGKEVARQAKLNFQVSNIYRGTHRLSVNLLDKSGKIIQSKQSTFTVHRPIAR